MCFLLRAINYLYLLRNNMLSLCRFSYGVAAQHYDLHIKPVLAHDAGVYTCVDMAGMGQRANASLSVLRMEVSTISSQRPTTTDDTAATILTSSHTVLTNHKGKDHTVALLL